MSIKKNVGSEEKNPKPFFHPPLLPRNFSPSFPIPLTPPQTQWCNVGSPHCGLHSYCILHSTSSRALHWLKFLWRISTCVWPSVGVLLRLLLWFYFIQQLSNVSQTHSSLPPLPSLSVLGRESEEQHLENSWDEIKFNRERRS